MTLESGAPAAWHLELPKKLQVFSLIPYYLGKKRKLLLLLSRNTSLG